MIWIIFSVALDLLLVLHGCLALSGRKKCINNAEVGWEKCLKSKAQNTSVCAETFGSSYTNCFFKKQPKKKCYQRCENKHKKCIQKKAIMVPACNNGFNFCVNRCFSNFPLASSLTTSCWNLCEGDYSVCEQLMQRFAEIFICIAQRDICRKSPTCYRRAVPRS